MYNLIPDTLLNPLSPLPNFLQREEGKNSTKIFSSPQIGLCVFFHRIERSFNERLKYSSGTFLVHAATWILMRQKRNRNRNEFSIPRKFSTSFSLHANSKRWLIIINRESHPPIYYQFTSRNAVHWPSS